MAQHIHVHLHKTRDAAVKRLIDTFTGNKTSVRVYYDSEWEEYQCELWYKKPMGWQLQNKATYHTDDKGDALSTAKDMLRRADARTDNA